MKHFIIFIIVFALIKQTKAQVEWAPIGAIWYYGMLETPFMPPYQDGYVLMESIKDTVILEKTCKILHKINYRTDGDTVDLGIDIIYSDEDKVYHYLYDQFYVLYDFTAQPGDTLKIKEQYYTGYHPDTTFMVVVDSVDIENIDGEDLRILYLKNIDLFGWVLYGKVIEKIGNVGYMFPFHEIDCDMAQCIYPLRCYSDSIIYYKHYYLPCDTIITNINDLVVIGNNCVKIIPNPFDDIINIKTGNLFENEDISSLTIYNILGHIVFNEPKLIKNEINIDMSHLKKGIYIVKIISNKYKYIVSKIIIKK